jgi:NADPH2:quinone reductase
MPILISSNNSSRDEGSSSVRAIEITHPGRPDVLRIGSRPDLIAGLGEALIEVHASGINRPDILQRKGRYPAPAGASDILGLEVAGRIQGGDLRAIESAGFHIGDFVCALVSGGGYAQQCVAPVAQCLPIPAGLSLLEAASLPETFFTVWSNVFEDAALQAGESFLVHGGSSGIGVAAIQLAKAFGAVVFATAGNDQKCEFCRELGADAVINYRTTDFVRDIDTLTSGKGVDIILDMVSGDYLPRNIDCLAEGGRLQIIALMGGVQGALDCAAVLQRRLRISGSMLRLRSGAEKARIAEALKKRVWPHLASSVVKPVISRIFSAEDVVQAHEFLESGRHIGKVVLDWGRS